MYKRNSLWRPCPTNAAWLNSQGFSNAQDGATPYWSATTASSNTAYAWSVFFHAGGVIANPKFGYYYVWPVRGG